MRYRLMSIRGVRQQRYGTRPFYSYGKLTLMFGAIARYAPGNYLAALGNILFQTIYILIIYLIGLIGAKSTHLFAHPAVSSPGPIISFPFFAHLKVTPLFLLKWQLILTA
jgi:hypothetical protein